MRLRRRASSPGRQRQPRAAEPAPVTQSYVYRARRRQDENITGHRDDRTVGKASWLQRVGLLLLLIAGTVSAINVLTLSSQAKVLPLTTDTSKRLLRDVSVYEAAAQQALAQSVWNRNKITVDTGRVSRDMLKQFPELAEVSITVPLLAHRPIVYVEPSQPALILAGSGGSFIVDSAGKALLKGESPETLNQSGIPVVNDQSGLKLEVDRQALPAPTVRFIQVVAAQLAAKNYQIASMALPPAASQLDVKLANQPYIIKFNLQSDKAREQAGTFIATIADLKKQNITPSQYVDVRVEGRAYYR